MGNIFYSLLTDGLDVFEDTSEEKAQNAIINGVRPKVPDSVKNSEDFVVKALRKMMYKCWKQKPEERPRARFVADYLSKQLTEFDNSAKQKSAI